MHDSSVVRLALLTTFSVVSAPWVGHQLSAYAYPAFPQADTIAKNATVKIQGSRNISTLNQSLKQGFEKQYPGAKVTIANSGTKTALDAVLAGKVDMAAIGRPLSDAEKAQGLVAIPIGREKIAIVVSKANPYTKDFTINQFAKVFRGEAKNWAELGGAKSAIQFVDRSETDTRKSFANYPAFQGKPFQTGSTAVKLADENPDTLSTKLGKSGLSFLPASLVDEKANVRALTMHGVKPTDARYPFSQPLYYVYKGDQPNNAVKAFLGYAGTQAGQAAMTAAGIAKAINFNNAAEAAAADKDAAAGAAAIAQAEKTAGAGTDTASKAGADKAGKAGTDQSAAMKTETGKVDTNKSAAGKDAAKSGDAIANNQIAVGGEAGRGIPPWLWWLLLPLGLLGLLLWLLPKDEEDEPPLRPSGTTSGTAGGGRPMRGIGNPLQGTGDAISGAVDTTGDAARRATGTIGNVADQAVDAVGDAAKSGGAAAAGIGAAIAGAGAAALGRLKKDRPQSDQPQFDVGVNAESEWEPGSNRDEFTIETPDWNLEENAEKSGNWIQDTTDRMTDAASAVKDKTTDTLNSGGSAITGGIAGAGAAAAGAGAAAWSVLSGRRDETSPTPNLDLSLPVTERPAEVNWEFEGGELPDAASLDASPRMADYAIDAATDATSTVQSAATNFAGNVAESSPSWLNRWLGKAKDVAEDTTASAAGVADRLKDTVSNTGAAAIAVGGAAVAGTGAAVGSLFQGSSRLVMVPYNSREALVRWEMDARAQEQMRSQGGNQLVLRLYDVTGMDPNAQDLPTFEQFDIDDSKQEQRILIPQRNRTYMTVLGYLTRSGGFLEVARSEVVQIPSA